MRLAILCLLASILFPSSIGPQNFAGVPVFQITPVESKIKFDVEASVEIQGTFDKWNAILTFTSTEDLVECVRSDLERGSYNKGRDTSRRVSIYQRRWIANRVCPLG